jgi:hypothetical protein
MRLHYNITDCHDDTNVSFMIRSFPSVNSISKVIIHDDDDIFQHFLQTYSIAVSVRYTPLQDKFQAMYLPCLHACTMDCVWEVLKMLLVNADNDNNRFHHVSRRSEVIDTNYLCHLRNK